MLRYLDQFWNNYRDVPKFAVAAFTEGHEGTSEVVGLLDEDIYQTLSNSSLSLNDTIVLMGEYFLYNAVCQCPYACLVSDHGLHMGLYFGLQTESALLENALPMWIGTHSRPFPPSPPISRTHAL